MQWRNDTTLPSRGLRLRPGKSNEGFRNFRTLGRRDCDGGVRCVAALGGLRLRRRAGLLVGDRLSGTEISLCNRTGHAYRHRGLNWAHRPGIVPASAILARSMIREGSFWCCWLSIPWRVQKNLGVRARRQLLRKHRALAQHSLAMITSPIEMFEAGGFRHMIVRRRFKGVLRAHVFRQK